MRNRWYPGEKCGVPIDGNGNLVSDGATTYTWDARDRLVSTGTSTYGYDPSNLRVGMSGQKVLLDGIEEAREYGASEARYDHDPSRVDGLLAQKTGAGKGYFVTDALGSVYAVVDASGAVVSKYGYDVYGARTATSEGMATGWGFTGRRHDSGTEMYHRARYLDGTAGRFIARDPLDDPSDAGVRSLTRRALPPGDPIAKAILPILQAIDSVDSGGTEPNENDVGSLLSYGYADNKPSVAVDQLGLVTCMVGGLSHMLTCVDKSGDGLLAVRIESGNDRCLNSPGCQAECIQESSQRGKEPSDARDLAGPLPVGPYRMVYRSDDQIALARTDDSGRRVCPNRGKRTGDFKIVRFDDERRGHGCIVIDGYWGRYVKNTGIWADFIKALRAEAPNNRLYVSPF